MARPAPTSFLTALGFAPAVDRAYRRLRSMSGRGLAVIAATELMTPEELLEEIEPLLRAGIARIEGDRLVVEPPPEALRIVLADQAVRAQRLRRMLNGLGDAVGLLAADTLAGAGAGLADGLPIDGEVVGFEDVADTYAMVRELVLSNRGDLLWLRPDQWRSPLERLMSDLVAEVVRSGARASRAIYPVHAVQEAPSLLAARAAAGEQVRVLPELPSRLLVIGDTHAVLPDPLGYADLPLILIRQRGIVEAVTQWFGLLWERAAAPAVTVRGGGRDQRRFLIQQLAAGDHDEQIARRLGLSVRTVRRRIADLMTELGADSRFQAGVEATRRGWI